VVGRWELHAAALDLELVALQPVQESSMDGCNTPEAGFSRLCQPSARFVVRGPVLSKWLDPQRRWEDAVHPRYVHMVDTRFLQRAQCSHCKRCIISYSNSVCPSVCLSVRPSVRPTIRPSVTRRYCVKTTARSTVQFAPLDSKMCLVL